MTRTQPNSPSLTEPESEAEARVKDQAVQWLVRLTSGHVTQADADAFRRWCNQSAEHARAFARIKKVWDALGQVADADKINATLIAFNFSKKR